MFCEENNSAFPNKIDKDNFRKKIITKKPFREIKSTVFCEENYNSFPV